MSVVNMLRFPHVNLGLEDTLRHAVKMLKKTKLDTLPVVDADNRVVGVFTKSLAYDIMLKGISLDEKIEPYYKRNPVTIGRDWQYETLVQNVKDSPVGAAVVVDEDEHSCGVFTKIDMILEMHKQEELLNEKLKAIYSSIQSGLIYFDNFGKVELVNESAARILKIKGVQGRNINELLPFLEYPLDKTEIGKKVKYKDSRLIMNKIPIKQDNLVMGGLVVLQDISDLEEIACELESVKRFYRMLETVVELAYDGLFVTDEKGTITLANSSLAYFLGLEKNDMLGHNIDSFVKNNRVQEVQRSGIQQESVHYLGGNPYIISYEPIVRKNVIIGVVGKVIFRDINEFKRLYKKIETLDKAPNQGHHQLEEEREKKSYTFEDIVSINPGIQKLKKDAHIVSKSRSNVIIYGESGTGKEVLAHAIHNAGQGPEAPFIKINCAALPENLLESELFGYEKGAFTGASRGGKPGKFELADDGTLFLDEIGDMSLNLQAKLLRVLQDRSFERVGGTREITVNVRVIAATNQDLVNKVREGSFREDLYFRLNVIPLYIPPLRERKEDIVPLAYFFLHYFNSKMGRIIKEFDGEALEILKQYDWPGNVRELENVVEYSFNFAHDMIKKNHLPYYLLYQQRLLILPDSGAVASQEGGSEDSPEKLNYYKRKFENERDALLSALHSARGNKSEAAKILGISRSWLYKKLKQYSLM